MKKVLIYSVCEDINAVEAAKENIEKGNEVFIIECDSKLGNCQHNIFGSRLMCAFCYHSIHSAIKRLGLSQKVHLLRLSSLITKEDEAEAAKVNVEFNSVQELKDLTYKGAELGFGAFSSYVTFSRNAMPDMTEDFKDYIRVLFHKEVLLYNAIERLHHKYCFDLIIFHNGRFAQFKPFLEFAKINHIDYIATEVKIQGDKWMKDNFYNDVPHSISYLANNVLKNWEIGDPSTREEIGRSFFEKRKKGVPAGDKVYVKGQHAGEYPEGWDDNVENISIYNGSEDEYCSISKEWDGNLMFPNQYEALKTIFEHYKNDKTKHFYLRIHPNLKNVPYKSHLALFELKYDNVTIIPADSTISSYTLLDMSDKIIIFDSTIGLEAAYWGKPVIELTKYIYTLLGLLNNPRTPEEIWPLIDNKELKPIVNDNIIKYGYWCLQPNYPEFNKIPYRFVTYKVNGITNTVPTYLKAFGSYKLQCSGPYHSHPRQSSLEYC